MKDLYSVTFNSKQVAAALEEIVLATRGDRLALDAVAVVPKDITVTVHLHTKRARKAKVTP